ncbi:Protein LOT5 [Candida viswanathii]|uniref:Protein LOT5 n=1 Tax=Candida viswanathii TaxID=5486 RepID=A0A367Y5R4_9ASCO|nr:Protein LOT5 [Candida viswanathii]
MSQPVRLIQEPPNIENTIPYTVYQSSSPKSSFVEEDKLVIYGGGNNFSISSDVPLPNLSTSSVSVFVLNCSVIFWFNENHVGVEITYPSIIFHGLNLDFIYLNIEDNELMGNYVTIRTNPETPSHTNPLFNNLSATLQDIYNAISTVADMYTNEEDEEEDMLTSYNDLPRLDLSQAMLGDPDSVTPRAIPNTGQADDLDDDDMEDDDDVNAEGDHGDGKYGAGMHVDVGYASIAGTKTRRESDGFHEEHGNASYKTKRNRLA